MDGIPATEFVRVIREDPERAGLLFAGTERGVYVSFDAGAHWRTLKRNLPIVPVHDLAIKEGDVIAATHGRSFWILDDITPLRQLADSALSGDADGGASGSPGHSGDTARCRNQPSAPSR